MKKSYRAHQEQRLKMVTGIYNLFKRKRLRANIKLIPHKAIIKSKVACAYLRMEICDKAMFLSKL